MGNKNKFKVKKSSIEGMGCFATEPIKKSELICNMKGEEISISELKKRYKLRRERDCDPLQVGEKRYLDLKKPYVYINHSCNPNGAIIHRNELIAIKNIKKGEEITYDYSFTEWTDDKDWEGYDEWSMECNCKSPLCRKKIREFRFLPNKIQKKYINQNRVLDFICKNIRSAVGYNKSIFGKKVLKIVSKIPRGKTLNYKRVAELAGSPKAYRAVGNILNKNYNPTIPCHRVIRSNGKIGGYNRGVKNKIKLLKKEKAI